MMLCQCFLQQAGFVVSCNDPFACPTPPWIASVRTSCFTGQTHQPRGSERRGLAPGLTLSAAVPSRIEGDRKASASLDSLNLQVTLPRASSIFKGSVTINRAFTHY